MSNDLMISILKEWDILLSKSQNTLLIYADQLIFKSNNKDDDDRSMLWEISACIEEADSSLQVLYSLHSVCEGLEVGSASWVDWTLNIKLEQIPWWQEETDALVYNGQTFNSIEIPQPSLYVALDLLDLTEQKYLRCLEIITSLIKNEQSLRFKELIKIINSRKLRANKKQVKRLESIAEFIS